MSDERITLSGLDLTPPLGSTFVFTAPRDEALIYGGVVPTPEEVEAYNIKARESWLEAIEDWTIYDAARELLAAITDPLARAILDLHHSETIKNPECEGCDFGGYEGEPPAWPCRTVMAIAAHYGIALPSYIGSRPGADPHTMPPEGFTPFRPPLSRWHIATPDEEMGS